MDANSWSTPISCDAVAFTGVYGAEVAVAGAVDAAVAYAGVDHALSCCWT